MQGCDYEKIYVASLQAGCKGTAVDTELNDPQQACTASNLPSARASLLKPSASAARFRYDPLADCIPLYTEKEDNF